jgi:hypothetical protein
MTDRIVMAWNRHSLFRLGGIILAVAWLPLLLYIPYDAVRGGGGNPIGLGLLMLGGTLVGGAVMLLGVALCLVQRLRRRKERAS